MNAKTTVTACMIYVTVLVAIASGWINKAKSTVTKLSGQ